MGDASEGQQVVLAQRGERDGPGQDELVVALVVREGGGLEGLRGEQFGIGPGDTSRGVGEAFAVLVDAERVEQLGDGACRPREVDHPARGPAVFRCDAASVRWWRSGANPAELVAVRRRALAVAPRRRTWAGRARRWSAGLADRSRRRRAVAPCAEVTSQCRQAVILGTDQGSLRGDQGVASGAAGGGHGSFRPFCRWGGGAVGGITCNARPAAIPTWLGPAGSRSPSQNLCQGCQPGRSATQSPCQLCFVPTRRRGAYLAARRARANAAIMRPKSRSAMSQKTCPPSPLRAMLKTISLVMIPPSHPART